MDVHLTDPTTGTISGAQILACPESPGALRIFAEGPDFLHAALTFIGKGWRGLPNEKAVSHPGSGGRQDACYLAADAAQLPSTRF